MILSDGFIPLTHLDISHLDMYFPLGRFFILVQNDNIYSNIHI